MHKNDREFLVFGGLGLACEGQPYFFICQQQIGFGYPLDNRTRHLSRVFIWIK